MHVCTNDGSLELVSSFLVVVSSCHSTLLHHERPEGLAYGIYGELEHDRSEVAFCIRLCDRLGEVPLQIDGLPRHPSTDLQLQNLGAVQHLKIQQNNI